MIERVLNDEVRHGDVILLTPKEQSELSCSPWQFVLNVDTRWWKHVYIETVKGTIKRIQPYRVKNNNRHPYVSTIDRLDPYVEYKKYLSEKQKDDERALELYFEWIKDFKKGIKLKGDMIIPRIYDL